MRCSGVARDGLVMPARPVFPSGATMMLDRFTRAYIECALWSSCDDSDDWLDANYCLDDCSESFIKQASADCDEFRERAVDEHGMTLEGYDDDDVAHDFWLTRNRHGAGFWDGDYEDEVGAALTDLSHSFGECWLYVGDDGLIYQG